MSSCCGLLEKFFLFDPESRSQSTRPTSPEVTWFVIFLNCNSRAESAIEQSERGTSPCGDMLNSEVTC